MSRSLTHTLVTLTAGLLLVVLLSDVADAQRRRRRRRRPEPPPTEQPAETPDAGADEADAGEGEGETPAAAAPTEGEGEAEAGEAPAEEAPAAAPVDEEVPLDDLSPLRSDLATLMDDLVQVRSRIAVLGRQLFETQVRLRVENRAGDDQIVSRLVLRLDGDPVHRGDEDPGDEGRQLHQGFAAPGPHELTVEVEMRSRADEEYRYLSSTRFRFQVVRGKLTEVIVTLDDDSDIAEDFEDDGEGEYDLNVRVRVATRELTDEE